MIVNRKLALSKGCDLKDRWRTPLYVFNPLNAIFNFTLDPSCDVHSALCNKYYTELEDGLIQDWSNEVVFCNPPYSRGNIDKWMEKCYLESLKGSIIVALIPVSTSAKWWHKYVIGKASIKYYEGRIRFVGADFTAPFSSCLAIYNSNIILPESIKAKQLLTTNTKEK